MRRVDGAMALLFWALIGAGFASVLPAGWTADRTATIAMILVAAHAAVALIQLGDLVPGGAGGRWGRSDLTLLAMAILAVGGYVAYGTAIGLAPARIAMRAGVALLPLLISRFMAPRGPGLDRTDLLIIAAIWLPLELGRQTKMPLPPGKGMVDLAYLVHLNLALFVFATRGRVPSMGLGLAVEGRELGRVILITAGFMAVALPLALHLGFVTPRPVTAGVTLLTRFLGLLLLVALPEEILFRGVMQKQGERAFPGSPWAVLAITSLIFGLAHSNNPQPPYWTFSLGGGLHVRFAWAYVLLASLAGVAYGWTYRRSGKLMAAALVHALVDWIWWAGFKGP